MSANHSLPSATPPPRPGRRVPWRALAWALLALLALFIGWQIARDILRPPAPLPAVSAPTATATTPAPAVYPTPDPGFVAASATPAAPPTPAASQPLATPTLAGDETLLRLSPAASQAGWVSSAQERGNQFGDSFLHTGVVDGQIFHGALQVDLARVPRGAPLRYAALYLTGLDDNRLARDVNSAWSLRWLDPAINEQWSRLDFQDIHNAAVFQTLLPPLTPADLAPLVQNQFVFSPEQLRLLEQALLDNQTQLALRLDGPEAGANSLFAWDSGYGAASQGSPPLLLVVAGPPPATPPPIPTADYIVVTSTPTPANVLTAAAILLQATAQAAELGSATPTPRNLVTATPTPENQQTAEAQRLLAGLPLITTPTPAPENDATAAAMAAYATAVAVTTGTFTPLPADHVTATPIPPQAVVTNTPTAASIFQLLNRAIFEATRTATAGPPTPWPAGLVTATPTRTGTPTPANAETAQARIIMVTIEALSHGTWTPTPTRTPAPAGVATPATPRPPAVITLVEGAAQGVVANDLVNVRAGPGAQYPVVAVLPAGTRLSLTGRSADSSWLFVCCVNGQSVWLAQFLIQPEASIDELPIQPAPNTG